MIYIPYNKEISVDFAEEKYAKPATTEAKRNLNTLKQQKEHFFIKIINKK